MFAFYDAKSGQSANHPNCGHSAAPWILLKADVRFLSTTLRSCLHSAVPDFDITAFAHQRTVHPQQGRQRCD